MMINGPELAMSKTEEELTDTRKTLVGKRVGGIDFIIEEVDFDDYNVLHVYDKHGNGIAVEELHSITDKLS